MKLVLLLVLCCLALHNGKGAPRTARYMHVRCNPTDKDPNCVTHQGPEIPWTPDLPAQLPASSAAHLETEPVEEKNPDREEEEEKTKDEPLLVNDEGESPTSRYEAGSGFFEGSAYEDPFFADQGLVTTESETGSGGRDTDLNKGEDMRSWIMDEKPKEQDLKEDGLLLPQ